MLILTAKHFEKLSERNSPFQFPKYSKPILNIATQNSQATRVNVVGSMKELFLEFLSNGGKSLQNWKDFYYAKNGEIRIENSSERLHSMLKKMPVDAKVFTKELAKNYIIDLVIYKTHFGMSGEYYSVLAVGDHFKLPVRWSNAKEESEGIDAWLGSYPIQVKPHDSVKMNHVYNHADTNKTLVITYESKKDRCFIHNPEIINK